MASPFTLGPHFSFATSPTVHSPDSNLLTIDTINNDNNNNSNSNNESEEQWKTFCSQHCKVWFGTAVEMNDKSEITDDYKVMHSYKIIGPDLEKVEHKNVYYYDDNRGVLTSGPKCGPWYYLKRESLDVSGVRHPRWGNTRCIFFATGDGLLFNNSPMFYNNVTTCAKMIFQHPARSNIRLSLMAEFNESAFSNLKVHQENSEGWKSDFWESQKHATSAKNGKRLKLEQKLDRFLNLETTQLVEVAESNAELGTTPGVSFESLQRDPKYQVYTPTPTTKLVCPKSLDGLEGPMYFAGSWNAHPDAYLSEMVVAFDENKQFTEAFLSVYETNSS